MDLSSRGGMVHHMTISSGHLVVAVVHLAMGIGYAQAAEISNLPGMHRADAVGSLVWMV